MEVITDETNTEATRRRQVLDVLFLSVLIVIKIWQYLDISERN